MKFVTIRELRNRPGRVWDDLRDDDLVLTANGKPVGILVGVEEEGLEDALASLRRARAMQATSRLRRQAAKSGARDLPPRQVAAEIRAVRRQRSS
ncbi:MAG TPA: type II toxin-antitoxin system Phd/YefM family antitoxin [Thermoanaerobaculia bacterium]|jgi:antitoxin (DNA-binding transcriptional repressor) of toxin-antitoxin stability system|nr:type II toxin-antitoxin system Phd/YefM family antitoxin [Thermoanaerobaculia bacterium]